MKTPDKKPRLPTGMSTDTPGVNRWRGVVEMPRWEHAEQTIKSIAWLCELKLDIKKDVGWLSETLYFEVTGTAIRIACFVQQLQKALPIQGLKP